MLPRLLLHFCYERYKERHTEFKNTSLSKLLVALDETMVRLLSTEALLLSDVDSPTPKSLRYGGPEPRYCKFRPFLSVHTGLLPMDGHFPPTYPTCT